ncbi:MAG: hypothetical protein BZY82_00875 [SAR202 cluster bacterium Io17-Chloro-G3]|nr:MAG: hypothetical protein BZY82_00875 [SAR202 cluster bacterium Io17-Chloro-G3]
MVPPTLATHVPLSGDDFLELFSAARACVELNVDRINSLNVFPVPDGDTGTNMLLTMKSSDEELSKLDGATVSQVAECIARETLMGARGNSGVILCQIFQGMALALEGSEFLDGQGVAAALLKASEAAYRAVSKPVEGTILTVVREAALGAKEAAENKPAQLIQVWERATGAARDALAKTPDLLPVLKEAGVVDSGGFGLVAFFEGGLAYLREDEVKVLEIETGQLTPGASYLAATEEEMYGYCTQFLIQGSALEQDAVREKMTSIADSTVVVGDAEVLKIHVHTYDPGSVLSYGVSLGSLTQIKIDNIDQQHQEFMALHEQPVKTVALGVVAVVSGAGLQRLFRNLGCSGIVHGGQTMNPSTGELVKAAEVAPAESVVLLPNNRNIVGAAEQAVTASTKSVHVLPTSSIPQGIAALLAFNPDYGAEINLEQMNKAANQVRSGEVTTAVRGVSIEGIEVNEGQAIGLLDSMLVSADDTIEGALQGLVRAARPGSGDLVTLYWGGDVRGDDADKQAEWIRSDYPYVEVEVVQGGQMYYHYFVSFE